MMEIDCENSFGILCNRWVSKLHVLRFLWLVICTCNLQKNGRTSCSFSSHPFTQRHFNTVRTFDNSVRSVRTPRLDNRRAWGQRGLESYLHGIALSSQFNPAKKPLSSLLTGAVASTGWTYHSRTRRCGCALHRRSTISCTWNTACRIPIRKSGDFTYACVPCPSGAHAVQSMYR